MNFSAALIFKKEKINKRVTKNFFKIQNLKRKKTHCNSGISGGFFSSAIGGEAIHIDDEAIGIGGVMHTVWLTTNRNFLGISRFFQWINFPMRRRILTRKLKAKSEEKISMKELRNRSKGKVKKKHSPIWEFPSE